MKTFKVIVEKRADGYVAYSLGIAGAVVGQGPSYDEALAGVKSAIRFHLRHSETPKLRKTPSSRPS